MEKILFLYRSNRHSSRYLKKSVTTGEFHRQNLRRGVGDNYLIHGHGEHPFQQQLFDCGLEKEFSGHVLEINGMDNATWVRLAFDQVTRGTTTFMGAIAKYDTDEINTLKNKGLALSRQLSDYQAILQKLENLPYCSLPTPRKCGESSGYSAQLSDEILDKPEVALINQNYDARVALQKQMSECVNSYRELVNENRQLIGDKINLLQDEKVKVSKKLLTLVSDWGWKPHV